MARRCFRSASIGSPGRNFPPHRVKEVDFLIDGRLGWVEKKTPYVYADDGNWLVTSILTPKKHTFSVRVVSTTGTVVSDTVTARVVAPPPPPAKLAGTWSRIGDGGRRAEGELGAAAAAGSLEGDDREGRLAHDHPQNGGGLFDVDISRLLGFRCVPRSSRHPSPTRATGGSAATPPARNLDCNSQQRR